MSLFSDEHGPPHFAPAAGYIPLGVKQSLLDWLHEREPSIKKIWKAFKHDHGYGSLKDVIGDVHRRFGEDPARDLVSTVNDGHEEGRRSHDPEYWQARAALAGLPATLFLDAIQIELGRRLQAQAIVDPSYFDDGTPLLFEETTHVNGVLARRGISYRLNSDWRFEWVGDSGAHELVIKPALRVLDEPRLSGARGDFERALAHLRLGTEKDMEQANAEAAKSVESAMKSVLDSHGVSYVGAKGASQLWDRLYDEGIVPKNSREALVGAAIIGNPDGRHGSAEPHQVPTDLAVLAVQSAAVVIVYLAPKLKS